MIVRARALRRDATLVVDDCHTADVPAEVGGIGAINVYDEVVLATRQRQTGTLRAAGIHALLKNGTATDHRRHRRVGTIRLRSRPAIQHCHRAYSRYEVDTVGALLQRDCARLLDTDRQLETVVVCCRRATEGRKYLEREHDAVQE